MALGNAWHIPENPEPRGRAGMRDPVGAIVFGTAVTIISGNQFQGGGNPGNQLQVGSAVFVKKAADANWTLLPLIFSRTLANNKYYAATIAPGTFNTGDVVQYYLRIAYDDHDTTFLHANGNFSATTGDEAVARQKPFTFAVEDRAVKGQWDPVFTLPNVAIHASVLPTGNVLMWGRRDKPDDSLDVQECTPFVWNPKTRQSTFTPQPELKNGMKFNLFCAGHSFTADGRLLVVGGHLEDSDGISQAALYDSATDTWIANDPMKTPSGQEVRRWYPTATTLPNGDILVLSGSYIDRTRPPGKQIVVADLLQVWSNGVWKTIAKPDGTPLNFIGLPLYPRMHVASDGRVFMSGTNDRTLLLKTSAPGGWTEVAFRAMGNRDYCPSVMYEVDKILYAGGGNNQGTHAPTAEAEVIDLGASPPKWRKTAQPMKFPRRQHNGVLLPDGTVLVVGGTRGGGGPNNGFNDLNPGAPVHVAELWDPATDRWTELTAESIDRCYHATAVLLPDATVLSAGGGEYKPDNVNPNDPEDSQRNGQIFSPPYLFKGNRPDITSAPQSVDYGQAFQVGTSAPAQIGKVSWIRLPSVTHSIDQNQRINFLSFSAGATSLTVTAPQSPNVCPPGHYMLFVVSKTGVPSVAQIVQIKGAAVPFNVLSDGGAAVPLHAVPAAEALEPVPAAEGYYSYEQVYAREAEIERSARGTHVVIGITGTCPYGIGSCWGGAYEALGRLDRVAFVGPVPDTDDSTCEVYLEDGGLPDLELWHEQFRKIVNGTYEMRGVEVTVQGTLEQESGEMLLVSGGPRPAVRLKPLQPGEKIHWSHVSRQRKPLKPEEADAYERLTAVRSSLEAEPPVTITGTLESTGTGYELHIRSFSVTEG